MSFFINIDGKEVKAYKGQTVLDAAKSVGIEIPTLCHDERVEMYGSCGVCCVEDEGSGRLLRSCSTYASPGMIVKTDTPKVVSSRKSALELLLSDHTGDCRPPCVLACPAQTDCQGYVGLVANGEFEEASKVLKDRLPLPGSIGRVCPHPCEDACRRELVEEPIAIAHIKSFIADKDLEQLMPYMPEVGADSGKSVCIVGGGPGGLSSAYFLRQMGHEVTILDMMPQMGGMLRYGIPEYRLPAELLDIEIEMIESMDVEMINNVKVGRDFNLDYIRNNYDSVILAVGAWESTELRCEGEDLENVVGGIDFLQDVQLNKTDLLGKNIAVVGGGNTAMDVVRTSVRLGASNVYNVYRRTKEEMPAEPIEIIEAEEEGVIFKNLTNPIEVVGKDGKVDSMRLQIMELGEKDDSGRRRPIPVEGEEETLDVDMVVVAIGQRGELSGFEEVSQTDWQTIKVDEDTFRTNLDGVFAIGDVINDGADIAIKAIGDAHKSATLVDAYLHGEDIAYEEPYLVKQEKVKEDFAHEEKHERVPMAHMSPEERKDNFLEVNYGYTEEEAIEEANRCLECGCHDYFECKLINYAQEYRVEPEKFDGEKHNRTVDNSHPFIERDPDKCILCGLCIRVCEEQMGSTALGLVDRGFDAMVAPAMELPLADTDCISCGQCVHVCPTGALQEKINIMKPVPVEEEEVMSTCTFCSVGCPSKVTARGDMVLRSLPKEDTLLCSKGRFGFATEEGLAPIELPMIKVDGEFVEEDFYNSFIYTVKKMQTIRAQHGEEAIGIAVSDRYTNEEIAMIKELALEGFRTDNVFSFNKKASGVEAVLGIDGSTTTLEEMVNSPVIVVLSKNIAKSHTIAGMLIRRAVNNGAKLITIAGEGGLLDDLASKNLSGDDLDVLAGLIKAVLEEKNVDEAKELATFVKSANITDEIKEVADVLLNTPKATYVFAENEVSKDAAILMTELASIAGHVGSARSGVLALKPNANSQGIADLGVKSSEEAVADINSGKLKGLIIFGEDVPAIDLSGLEFLAVQDAYLTGTAEMAHVVLPGAPFGASTGQITRTDGVIQDVNKVIHNHVDNQEIIWSLCYETGHEIVDTVCVSPCKEISTPEYLVPENKDLFEEIENTSALYSHFMDFADEKGLKASN